MLTHRQSQRRRVCSARSNFQALHGLSVSAKDAWKLGAAIIQKQGGTERVSMLGHSRFSDET